MLVSEIVAVYVESTMPNIFPKVEFIRAIEFSGLFILSIYTGKGNFSPATVKYQK